MPAIAVKPAIAIVARNAAATAGQSHQLRRSAAPPAARGVASYVRRLDLLRGERVAWLRGDHAFSDNPSHLELPASICCADRRARHGD